MYEAVSGHGLLPDWHQAHDDVIKWNHFPHYWPFVRGIHRSPVNSPHKGQWRGALTFSLICVWINGWVNNREAGDFRCHHTHYDFIVMPLAQYRDWNKLHRYGIIFCFVPWNLGAKVAIKGANNKLCILHLILNREQNFAPTLNNLGAFRVNDWVFRPSAPLNFEPCNTWTNADLLILLFLWSCIMYFQNCAANKDMFELNLRYPIIWLICLLQCIKFELNWNWKKMNWIGIELKDSESDLNWNWIELKNPESNLNWNWIELKEMNWSEPWMQ